MVGEHSRKPMNPTALSIADAARLLGKVSGRLVPESLIRADLEAGAPANADGTINLVHYAAWLVRESGASTGEPNAN